MLDCYLYEFLSENNMKNLRNQNIFLGVKVLRNINELLIVSHVMFILRFYS